LNDSFIIIGYIIGYAECIVVIFNASLSVYLHIVIPRIEETAHRHKLKGMVLTILNNIVPPPLFVVNSF